MGFLRQYSQLHEMSITVIPPWRWRSQGSVGLSGLSKVPLLIPREAALPAQKQVSKPPEISLSRSFYTSGKREGQPHILCETCAWLTVRLCPRRTLPIQSKHWWLSWRKDVVTYMTKTQANWVDLEAPSTVTLESRMWNPSSALSRLFFGTLKLWTSQDRLWPLCLLPNLKLTQSHLKRSFFPPSFLNKLNFKQGEFCFSC